MLMVIPLLVEVAVVALL